MKSEIATEYFDWLTDMVDASRYEKNLSFSKLLRYLHQTEFSYSIPRDENRYEDGLSLRYRFITSNRYDISYLDELEGPCSILEMMVALAIRCEETIMDDWSKGNRTGQWFWEMIASLGLGSMIDSRYDKKAVDDIIDRFLNREYEPNGKGGLFRIRHPEEYPKDIRDVEIWTQMCWYLDDII